MMSNKVCIVGVGYVGEHLVSAFSKSFVVGGYDITPKRVVEMANHFKDNPNVTISSDPSILENAGLYCISVPTLLQADNTINDTYLKSAVATVAKYAQPEACVVMESSVSVGMTRNLTSFLRNMGVFVGFSPERVDPGRTSPSVDQIPKIISGMDADSFAAINNYYTAAFDTVVKVSSMETAEMCKLYENCFRMINIAYVNEIADACKKHNINHEEMIDACSTKPFGFMAFRPGLGVGGYCIPINPFYLFINNELPLLKQATTTTMTRPHQKAAMLCEQHTDVQKIAVVGVAFKPGQKITANSPAYEFVKALEKEGKTVVVYDPLVETTDVELLKHSNWTPDYLNDNFDMVVVAMKQHDVDYTILSQYKGKVVYAENI